MSNTSNASPDREPKKAAPEVIDDPSVTMIQASSRIGPLKLFTTFMQLTLSGFGGVLPFAHRMLVEKRRWLTPTEFAEMFAIAQMLPGPPIVHMAQMLGHRDSGWRGGAAAVLGLVSAPTVLMMIMGLTYERLGDAPVFRGALAGMSAAAVALIIVMGFKLSSAVPRRIRPWIIVVLAFVCLGLLRLPFIATILVVTPLSVWLAWGEEQKAAS